MGEGTSRSRAWLVIALRVGLAGKGLRLITRTGPRAG